MQAYKYIQELNSFEGRWTGTEKLISRKGNLSSWGRECVSRIFLQDKESGNFNGAMRLFVCHKILIQKYT